MEGRSSFAAIESRAGAAILRPEDFSDLVSDLRSEDELPGSASDDLVEEREPASRSVSFSARFSVFSSSESDLAEFLDCSVESSSFLPSVGFFVCSCAIPIQPRGHLLLRAPHMVPRALRSRRPDIPPLAQMLLMRIPQTLTHRIRIEES